MLIRFNFKNPLESDQYFVDCDSIPVLEDATDQYGVKRNDTSVVIVAAGTSMTKVGTGSYEYTFQEPVYGLVYTYVVKATYNSVVYYFTYNRLRGIEVFQNDLYAQVSDLKTYIDYTSNGYTDTDTELEALLRTASILIENYCHREFFNEKKLNTKALYIIKNVCLSIASRLREDPDMIDTTANSETIGRYSYSGNSSGNPNINGLTPNEYLQLQPYRRLKGV